MKKIVLLLLISLKSFSQIKDDTKHFYISAFGSAGISEITYRITHKPVLSGFTGSIVMFSIGYFKERFYDVNLSEGDLFHNGYGSVTGSLCWGVHFDIKGRIYLQRQKEFSKLQKQKNTL